MVVIVQTFDATLPEGVIPLTNGIKTRKFRPVTKCKWDEPQCFAAQLSDNETEVAITSTLRPEMGPIFVSIKQFEEFISNLADGYTGTTALSLVVVSSGVEIRDKNGKVILFDNDEIVNLFEGAVDGTFDLSNLRQPALA